MRKAKRGTLETARMLTLEQVTDYVGLGRNTARAFCDQIGATVRFGDRTVRFDRFVLDSALDEMVAQAAVGTDTDGELASV